MIKSRATVVIQRVAMPKDGKSDGYVTALSVGATADQNGTLDLSVEKSILAELVKLPTLEKVNLDLVILPTVYQGRQRLRLLAFQLAK